MVITAVAKREITPTENVPLFGYGDRTHDSTGVHDPLFAYTWWLQGPEQDPWVWAALDVCVLSVASAGELTRAVAQRAGLTELSPPRILLSTTHTHSGPDTWQIHRDQRPWARRYYALLVERLTEAVLQARQRARPCRIQVREGRGELGVNRRDPKRPVDPRILLLSLVDEAGALQGMLFHYSCHLTVLGVDNYRVSADWAGPVRQDLEDKLGVPVAYLQGAEGNVDPRTRGRLDMADPDQARGSSFAILRELASGVTQALARALATAPLAQLRQVRVDSWQQLLPLRYGPQTEEGVRARLEGWKGQFAGFLGLEASQVPEDMSINVLVKERCRALHLPPEEVSRWVASQFAYVNFLASCQGGQEGVDALRGTASLPCCLVDFGRLSVCCAPVEILVEAAFDWQKRHPERFALLSGLTQGWLGYLPHESNFAEAETDQLYETVSTVFAPEACGRLLDEAGRRL
jgi:hypothetical protein